MKYTYQFSTSKVIIFICSILPTLINGLTITSPSSGTNIDPSQSIIITWTSTSTDPPIFDLKLQSTNVNSLDPEQSLATGISTASGSYTLPPYSILAEGAGYEIQAISNGNILSQIGQLTMAAGGNAVITASNGQLSFVGGQSSSTITVVSAPAPTTPVAATPTPSSLSGTETTATSETSQSSSITTSSSSTHSKAISSITSKASSASSSTSASSSSSSSTATTNGQSRLGDDLVLSAVGMVVGVIALLA